MARVVKKPIRKNGRTRPRPEPAFDKEPRSARGNAPIDLYFWRAPNGWKPTIRLEEAGPPYTVIPVDIAKGQQFNPEFLAFSPNNRIPAILAHDGPDGKPNSIFESGAILQYLGRKTGKFYPH